MGQSLDLVVNNKTRNLELKLMLIREYKSLYPREKSDNKRGILIKTLLSTYKYKAFLNIKSLDKVDILDMLGRVPLAGNSCIIRYNGR